MSYTPYASNSSKLLGEAVLGNDLFVQVTNRDEAARALFASFKKVLADGADLTGLHAGGDPANYSGVTVPIELSNNAYLHDVDPTTRAFVTGAYAARVRGVAPLVELQERHTIDGNVYKSIKAQNAAGNRSAAYTTLAGESRRFMDQIANNFARIVMTSNNGGICYVSGSNSTTQYLYAFDKSTPLPTEHPAWRMLNADSVTYWECASVAAGTAAGTASLLTTVAAASGSSYIVFTSNAQNTTGDIGTWVLRRKPSLTGALTVQWDGLLDIVKGSGYHLGLTPATSGQEQWASPTIAAGDATLSYSLIQHGVMASDGNPDLLIADPAAVAKMQDAGQLLKRFVKPDELTEGYDEVVTNFPTGNVKVVASKWLAGSKMGFLLDTRYFSVVGNMLNPTFDMPNYIRHPDYDFYFNDLILKGNIVCTKRNAQVLYTGLGVAY